ncbi:macro domain-containing protein [Oleispirillum naphthae]|uniref:macro domain-containing protein n=1 Tax=Oleispirillum naphthae TaxID=2838853 RepID=UPI0030826020
MIEPVRGDLLAADAEALVNAVNCVGVMGGGLAAQFKAAFPENFRAYAAACARGEVRLGRMHVFATGYPRNPRLLVNFPTLFHWSDGSRLEHIESGLAALAAEIRGRSIRSIAVPPLGCGIGGLSWADVRPRIEAALGGIPDLRVLLYQPR